MYVFGALAILYNPIIPIHLHIQVIWTALNVVTIILLYQARLAFEGAADGQGVVGDCSTDTGTRTGDEVGQE